MFPQVRGLCVFGLITRRSRVQIPPPLRTKTLALQGLSAIWGFPLSPRQKARLSLGAVLVPPTAARARRYRPQFRDIGIGDCVSQQVKRHLQRDGSGAVGTRKPTQPSNAVRSSRMDSTPRRRTPSPRQQRHGHGRLQRRGRQDWYETTLGKSSVETIIGDIFQPQDLLRHLPGRPQWNRSDGAWVPASTSFRDRITENWVRVLIDFLLISDGLQPDPGVVPPYFVWNPYSDPVPTAAINAQLRNASDHFPVTVDLV